MPLDTETLTLTLLKLREMAPSEDAYDAAVERLMAHAEQDGGGAELSTAAGVSDDADGLGFARWYADLLDALEVADPKAAAKVADDANDELEETGWQVERDHQGRWKPVDISEDAESAELSLGWELASARATGDKWEGKSGRWFTKRADGRVVPTKNPHAQPKQSAGSRAREAFASGRKVNREELAKKLRGHVGDAEAGEYHHRRATSSARMFSRHHGEATAHRIEQLSETLESALGKISGDDWRSERARRTLKEKLGQLGLALGKLDELEATRKRGETGGLPAGQRLGEAIPQATGTEQTGTGEGIGGGSGGVLPGADDAGDADVRETGRPGNVTRHRKGSGASGSSKSRVSEHDQSLLEPPTPDNPTDLAAGNYRYDDRDFFKGGAKAKFRANIEAIRTLRNIQLEGRDTATPAEQAIMAKFVGWGAFPQLFQHYDSYGSENWQKERELFRGMLSADEYEAARHSTLNAHYTHPDIVDLHWKIAQKLGFSGGKYLETSAGIGYYLGMMPAEIAAQTRSSAVELDPTTGAMLKMLYPSANVKVQGFEKFQAPDNFYDLIASNVPFAKHGVHDPRYNKYDARLHDYFFLKSADKVRPGGLIMHITSTGTMDKLDGGIRKALAEKGLELVSAVRFPADAHKENAGTSVVTDMLILRKKHPGEKPVHPTETPEEAQPKKPGFTGITVDSLGRTYHWKDGKRVPGPNWDDVVTVPDPAGGEPIPINRYFVDNPENVLGTINRQGSMYGPGEPSVSRSDDHDQRLEKFLGGLPEGLLKKAVAPEERFSPETAPAPGDVKEGGLQVRGGKVFVRQGGGMVEMPEVDAKAAARIAAHLELRDAVRACINDQLNGRDATASREALNEVYDAFVKKWGFLNLPANRRVFRADPDSPLLLALEKWDSEKKKAAKADIFTKTVVGSVEKVDRVSTIGEAVGVALHELGKIDLKRMGEVLRWHPDRVGKALVEAGLAFEDPSHGWQPADQYLSGNVRRKLALARAAAQTDPKYQPNVKALEEVQPEDIDHTEIDVKLGAGWVPPSDVAAFAAHLLEGRSDAFDVNYVAATGEWRFGYTKSGKYLSGRRLAQDVWGTPHKDFDDLVLAALNGKTVTVYEDTEPGEKKVVNTEATDNANAKISEIKQAFRDWIWEDDARRDRLHRHYNDNFNNVVPMKYNGAHQQFPGMNPAVKLRGHQKNFVWQVVTTGTGLAAHEVGTGKTYSMIAAAMELRRLGLARKPAIACLKANIESITADAIKAYPGAKILSTADMFDAKKRKETISRIATGDYDLILLTHDHLNLLQMKPETVADYIKEEKSELVSAKVEAEQEAIKAGKKPDPRFMKRLEDQIAAMDVRLQKALDASKKDDAVFFEETGIDQLFVDEAHMYKALPIYTKRDRVKGIPTGRSQRATNMHMRARWLQEQNGGRGVVFATGTPVANTMSELYTMQKYLQPQELKERGLWSFDAWANVFGDIDTKMEFTVSGEYKPVSRFSRFTNIPELMQVARQMMDVQRADDLVNDKGEKEVIRPKRKDHVIAAPKSEAMMKLMESLQQRAKDLKGKRPEELDGDNMLVICSDGRKGAMDMRLLDPDAPDDPDSKTNQAVRKVLELHKASPGKVQLIFSNVGVNPIGAKAGAADDVEGSEEAAEASSSISGGAASELDSMMDGKFHLYGDIIDKLVKGGIAREKIADFSQLKGVKKEEAMEAMRRGDIVVAIGSTEKLGTGVNVQDKIGAMHHLDVPWYPAAIEQRDGRGWRHGNENKEVDVFRYVSEGSLDQTFWQIVGNKASFIKQVVTSAGTAGSQVRVAKDDDAEELTPEQLMAAASGDPRILEKVNLDQEVKDLRKAKVRHEKEQAKFKNSVENQKRMIPILERDAAAHNEDAGALAKSPDFELRVGGRRHEDRKEAGLALEQFLKDNADQVSTASDYRPFEVGTYRGMRLVAAKGKLYLSGRKQYEVGSSLPSIEAQARKIPTTAQRVEQEAEAARKDVERVQAQIGKAWGKQEELDRKVARAAEIEKMLKEEKETPGKPSAAEAALPTNLHGAKLTGLGNDTGNVELLQTNIGGKDYVVKPSQHGKEGAERENRLLALARKAGLTDVQSSPVGKPSIPADAKMAKFSFDDDAWAVHTKVPGRRITDEDVKNPAIRNHVAADFAFNWVAGNPDRNDGNFLVDDAGKVHSVDFDSPPEHQPASEAVSAGMLSSLPDDTPISPEAIRRVLAVGDELVKGADGEAPKRLEAMRRLASKDKLTVGDLKRAGEAAPGKSSTVNLADKQSLQSALASAGQALPHFLSGEKYDANDPIHRQGHKVYIHDMYDALAPRLGGASLDDFKKALVDANKRGDITLSRDDLNANPRQAMKSEAVDDRGAVFHVVNVAPLLKDLGKPSTPDAITEPGSVAPTSPAPASHESDAELLQHIAAGWTAKNGGDEAAKQAANAKILARAKTLGVPMDALQKMVNELKAAPAQPATQNAGKTPQRITPPRTLSDFKVGDRLLIPANTGSGPEDRVAIVEKKASGGVTIRYDDNKTPGTPGKTLAAGKHEGRYSGVED